MKEENEEKLNSRKEKLSNKRERELETAAVNLSLQNSLNVQSLCQNM